MTRTTGKAGLLTILMCVSFLLSALAVRAQITRGPADPQALLEAGAALLRQGRYDSAEDTLRQAVALAPDNAMIHLFLGRALMAEQKYGDAAPEFAEALRLDAARPALGIQNRREAQDSLGLSYAFEKDFTRARKVYQAAIKSDPDYPSFSYNLACVCALAGDRKGALAALKQAEDADAKSSLGRTLPDPTADTDLKGLWGDPVFQAVLIMDQGPQPNDGPGSALMRAGARLLYAGDFKGAIEKESAATEKEPASARSWYFLGAACESAGQDSRAAAAFERAIAENVPPHNLLSKAMLTYAAAHAGLAWLRAGQPARAVKAFVEATQTSPYHPTPWYDLARAYAALGDETKAGDALKKAFDLTDNLQPVDPPLPDPAKDPSFAKWSKDKAWKAVLKEVSTETQGD